LQIISSKWKYLCRIFLIEEGSEWFTRSSFEVGVVFVIWAVVKTATIICEFIQRNKEPGGFRYPNGGRNRRSDRTLVEKREVRRNPLLDELRRWKA